MGAACGCDGETASTKNEVKQDSLVPGSKDVHTKPQVQGKANSEAYASGKPTLNNLSYEAKSEEQMTRL